MLVCFCWNIEKSRRLQRILTVVRFTCVENNYRPFRRARVSLEVVFRNRHWMTETSWVDYSVHVLYPDCLGSEKYPRNLEFESSESEAERHSFINSKIRSARITIGHLHSADWIWAYSSTTHARKVARTQSIIVQDAPSFVSLIERLWDRLQKHHFNCIVRKTSNNEQETNKPKKLQMHITNIRCHPCWLLYWFRSKTWCWEPAHAENSLLDVGQR